MRTFSPLLAFSSKPNNHLTTKQHDTRHSQTCYIIMGSILLENECLRVEVSSLTTTKHDRQGARLPLLFGVDPGSKLLNKEGF